MNIWLYPILPITPIALLYMSISDVKWWFRKPKTYCYRYHKPEWGWSSKRTNAPLSYLGGPLCSYLGTWGCRPGVPGVSNIFGGHRGHHEPWKNDTMLDWLDGLFLQNYLVSVGDSEKPQGKCFQPTFFGSLGMMKPAGIRIWFHLTQLAFEHDHLVRCFS